MRTPMKGTTYLCKRSSGLEFPIKIDWEDATAPISFQNLKGDWKSTPFQTADVETARQAAEEIYSWGGEDDDKIVAVEEAAASM